MFEVIAWKRMVNFISVSVSSFSDFPFLDYLAKRSRAERDLCHAEEMASKNQSTRAANAFEYEMQLKNLETINKRIAEIKGDIEELNADKPGWQKKNVENLTKHFYRKKCWMRRMTWPHLMFGNMANLSLIERSSPFVEKCEIGHVYVIEYSIHFCVIIRFRPIKFE